MTAEAATLASSAIPVTLSPTSAPGDITARRYPKSDRCPSLFCGPPVSLKTYLDLLVPSLNAWSEKSKSGTDSTLICVESIKFL